MFCILYSLIGIPLLLIFMGKVRPHCGIAHLVSPADRGLDGDQLPLAVQQDHVPLLPGAAQGLRAPALSRPQGGQSEILTCVLFVTYNCLV